MRHHSWKGNWLAKPSVRGKRQWKSKAWVYHWGLSPSVKRRHRFNWWNSRFLKGQLRFCPYFPPFLTRKRAGKKEGGQARSASLAFWGISRWSEWYSMKWWPRNPHTQWTNHLYWFGIWTLLSQAHLWTHVTTWCGFHETFSYIHGYSWPLIVFSCTFCFKKKKRGVYSTVLGSYV